MKHCGWCGAFIMQGRYCCAYCAQRDAARRKAQQSQSVVEWARNPYRPQARSGPITLSGLLETMDRMWYDRR